MISWANLRSSRRRSALVVASIALVGGLSVAVLEVDYRRVTRNLEQAVAATDNLLAARLAISRAHLAWQGVRAADPTVEPRRPVAELDRTHGLLDDLMEGRSSILGFRAAPLEDTVSRERALALSAAVSQLRELMLEGSELSTNPVEVRVRFAAVEDQAARLHQDVQASTRRLLASERRLHVGLLVAWSAFLLLLGVGVWALRAAADRARAMSARAEAERGSLAKRYAELQSLMDAGVVRVDDGGWILEATNWWKGVVASESFLRGRSWWSLVPPEDRESAASLWRTMAKRNEAFTLDVRMMGPDGSERWLTVRWRPVPGSGMGVQHSWVGTFVDVTQQRSVEAQLRQAQKLEAVGQMTGGLAHDFNNLLTVILANAELLRSSGYSITTASPDLVEDILRAAEGGRNLVARLMSFSRRGELELRPVSLANVVEDAAELGEKLLPSNIELKRITPEQGPTVLADPQSIQQVLLNLLANARDAMPDGGLITLEVDSVDVDDESVPLQPWLQAGRYGRVRVTDSGTGMDRDTLSRIFEPFFSTKGEARGTGLGLSSAHGIVRQHGGHIHVYSQLGDGTTFRIYLPAAEIAVDVATGPTPPPTPTPRRTPSSKKLRILLVEDDAALRRTARIALVRLGHEVVVAESGKHALELLTTPTKTVDVVVTDLSMPGVDGLELYARLRASGSTVPFLFTSGKVESQVAEGGRLPNEAVFLPKPWSITELERALHDAVSSA